MNTPLFRMLCGSTLTVKTIEGEIILGDELAEYKLIPPGKVKPWPFGTGPAVRDWLDRHRTAGV